MNISETALPSNRCRVLLVDDEPKVLRALSSALDIEFDIHTSTSVQEAKSLIKNQGHFDVIISDQIMPEAKGHELLNWCVENSINSKRIMLTGLPITKQLQAELVNVENVSFFSKPWNIEQIKQSLQYSKPQIQESENHVTMNTKVLIVEPSEKYLTLYSELPDNLGKPIKFDSANDLDKCNDKYCDAEYVILNMSDAIVEHIELIESLYNRYSKAQFLLTGSPKTAREMMHLETYFNRITILVKPFSLSRLLHHMNSQKM